MSRGGFPDDDDDDVSSLTPNTPPQKPSSSFLHPKYFWNHGQYEELQLLAFFTISRVAPLMLDDALQCNLPHLLLNFLSPYMASCKGCGGRTCHHIECCPPLLGRERFLGASIMVIQNLVATGDCRILDCFTELGAVNQFICLLKRICDEIECVGTDLKMNKHLVHVQIDLFTILSIFCEKDTKNKGAFDRHGIDMLEKYLKMDLSVLPSQLGHLNLLVSVIDCVWNCVVGGSSEDYFLDKNLLHSLLVILQKCPHGIKAQILGCLSDLLQNKKAVDSFNSWLGEIIYENYFNSLTTIGDGTLVVKKESLPPIRVEPMKAGPSEKGHITAPRLLCHLWRDEEARLGVLRDKNGIIIDLQNPLRSKGEENGPPLVQPAHHPSAAMLEIFENLRSKIYVIFNRIGFKKLPGLSGKDYITLAIIEHFLDLKVAEVLNEMIEEMSEEGLRPVTPDGKSISAMVCGIEMKHREVKDIQEQLLLNINQMEVSEEQKYYSEIDGVRVQEEWVREKFGELLDQAHPSTKVSRQEHYLDT